MARGFLVLACLLALVACQQNATNTTNPNSNPPAASSLSGALQGNLVFMSIVVLVGGVVSAAKKYVETTIGFAQEHPQLASSGFGVAAFYFAYNMFSLAASTAGNSSPLVYVWRLAFGFGGITMIFGPFLLLTPTNPIVLKSSQVAKQMIAVEEEEAKPWFRIILFLFLILMQGFVAYSLWSILEFMGNVAVELRIGIVVGYCLITLFFLIVFFSVILRVPLVVKNIDLLVTIRKNVKYQAEGQPPVDILSHPHYAKAYALGLVAAVGVCLGLIIYIFSLDLLLVPVGSPEMGIAVFSFILNMTIIIALTVVAVRIVLHPVDIVSEIKGEDGTLVKVDKIKYVAVARSADRQTLLKYATPGDPHTGAIEEVVRREIQFAPTAEGFQTTVHHPPWGSLHQSNDVRCMFFLATGIEYNNALAFFFLKCVENHVGDTYYPYKGFELYAPNEWTFPCKKFMEDLAASYSNEKALKGLAEEAEEWEREDKTKRAQETGLLSSLKTSSQVANKAIEDLLWKIQQSINAEKSGASPAPSFNNILPEFLRGDGGAGVGSVPSNSPFSKFFAASTIAPKAEISVAVTTPQAPKKKTRMREAKPGEMSIQPGAAIGSVNVFTQTQTRRPEPEKIPSPKDYEEEPRDTLPIVQKLSLLRKKKPQNLEEETEAQLVDVLRMRLKRLERVGGLRPGPYALSGAVASPRLVLGYDALSVTQSQAASSDAAPNPERLPTHFTAGPNWTGEGPTWRFTGASSPSNASIILADSPVPSNAQAYYFEVAIENSGDAVSPNCIAVGLYPAGVVPPTGPAEGMVGWTKGSKGLHGDDGFVYQGIDGHASHKFAQPATFTAGDIIGCYWNCAQGNIFWTKNGAYIGDGAFDVPATRCAMVPAVSSFASGAQVRINLGQMPFAYKVAPNLLALSQDIDQAWSCALSDLPVVEGVYTYEATITSSGADAQVCFGWSELAKPPLNMCPGFSLSTYGYENKLGNCCVSGRSQVFGPGFGPGDVISCQVDLNRGTLAYAKNGVFVGLLTHFVVPPEALYPMVAIRSAQTTVSVNFGANPLHFPNAFGEHRVLPFCRHDMLPLYDDAVSDLGKAILAIKVPDAPGLQAFVAGLNVLGGTLQQLRPFAQLQLSGRIPLAHDAQVLVENIVRCGLLSLRLIAAEARSSYALPSGVLDPCGEVSKNATGTNVDAFKNTFLPLHGALRSMRWLKAANPIQATMIVRSVYAELGFTPDHKKPSQDDAVAVFAAALNDFFDALFKVFESKKADVDKKKN